MIQEKGQTTSLTMINKYNGKSRQPASIRISPIVIFSLTDGQQEFVRLCLGNSTVGSNVLLYYRHGEKIIYQTQHYHCGKYLYNQD